MPGLYVTTKPCIRSLTHSTRLDSLTRTEGLTCPSKTRKPGSLAQVAGTNVYVELTNCLLSLACDRICPGRHLALRLLRLTVARILATFNILPPVDDDGRPRILEARFQKTLIM